MADRIHHCRYLDLKTLAEQNIPTEGSMDIHPVWMNNEIYFLSDRDFIMNVWAYNPATAGCTTSNRPEKR